MILQTTTTKSLDLCLTQKYMLTRALLVLPILPLFIEVVRRSREGVPSAARSKYTRHSRQRERSNAAFREIREICVRQIYRDEGH